jgi:hypothetical protein
MKVVAMKKMPMVVFGLSGKQRAIRLRRSVPRVMTVMHWHFLSILVHLFAARLKDKETHQKPRFFAILPPIIPPTVIPIPTRQDTIPTHDARPFPYADAAIYGQMMACKY